VSLGHEKLEVYRLAIACVAWVYEKAADIDGVSLGRGFAWR